MLTVLLIASVLSAAPAAGVDSDLASLEQYSAEELRELLRGLLQERAGSSSLTRDRVAALKQLAATDEDAAAWLARFPAEVRVSVEGAKRMEQSAFRAALTRVFRETGLPLVVGAEPGRSVLNVHVAFEENPRGGSDHLLGAMKSFSAVSTGAFETPEGAPLFRFVEVYGMLGINVGFSAQYSADKAAARLCDAIVRELALAVAGGLPVDGLGPTHKHQQKQLDAARAKVAKLRERQRPETAALIDGPFKLSVVPGPGVSTRLDAVFDGELRRLLEDVGLRVTNEEDARGGLRIVYDLTHFPGDNGATMGLRAAIEARSAAGETLFVGHSSDVRTAYFSANASFATALRSYAIRLVHDIVDALAGSDDRVSRGRPREDLKDALPVELRVLAAGFGNPLSDEIFASGVAAQLHSSLTSAGIPSAPASLAKSRLLVRVVKSPSGNLLTTISVPVADGKSVQTRTKTVAVKQRGYQSVDDVADDVKKAILAAVAEE